MRADQLQIPRFARDDKQKGNFHQHESERPFLREAEDGQGYALGRFGDLHLHNGRAGRGDFGGPQHRVLRENFAVHFGDKVILASCILAPDLSELDVLYGHKFFP